jgi:hypothetical protein
MAQKYKVVNHKKFTVKRAELLKHELEVLRDEMTRYADSLDDSYSIVRSSERSRAAVLNAAVNIVTWMCDRSDIDHQKAGEKIAITNNLYR